MLCTNSSTQWTVWRTLHNGLSHVFWWHSATDRFGWLSNDASRAQTNRQRSEMHLKEFKRWRWVDDHPYCPSHRQVCKNEYVMKCSSYTAFDDTIEPNVNIPSPFITRYWCSRCKQHTYSNNHSAHAEQIKLKSKQNISSQFKKRKRTRFSRLQTGDRQMPQST